MIENFHVLYYLPSGKKNQEKKTPIYCRITFLGERATFSTGKSVKKSEWDAHNKQVLTNKPHLSDINSYLIGLEKKIVEIFFKLESIGAKISAVSIKDNLLGKDTQKSKSLFKIFEEHNIKVKALINSDYAPGTYERYTTCLRHIKEFVKIKYNLNDYYLKDIDHEFITEFDFYLRSTRKCNNNTTVKYVKNFKKVVLIAIANSWINKDPFINYKFRVEKVDRGFLTADELKILYSKVFTITRVAQVKDIFVFQCYTGLSYIDTFKLTTENLVTDENGIAWIKTKRTKTNTLVNVPLLPIADEIIKKYKKISNSSNHELLLPVISNQKMNAYLKEIADLCGIEKNLSCHLARHTFATTVTLANGISLESVSKMLGHTNLLTTKIYARMLDSRVLDEMEILKIKLNAKVNF